MKRTHVGFLLLVVFFCFSCASHYIGKSVNLKSPMVCHCPTFPATYTESDDDFEVNYTIHKLEGLNEYSIKGTTKFQGSITWQHYRDARFTLLLVKDGVIFDTVSIAGGSGNISHEILFARSFTSKDNFDAALITLSMTVID